MTNKILKVAVLVAAFMTLAVLVPIVAQAHRPEAARAPIQGCQSQTVDNSGADGLTFSTLFDQHFFGTFRVSANCGNNIVLTRSNGWRFDGKACGEVWIRTINNETGNTLRLYPRKHVCGPPNQSTNVTLAANVPTNTRFRLEGWNDVAGDREAHLWYLLTIRF